MRPLLGGAGDLVRVLKGHLKGIHGVPQRDLEGLGFWVYLEDQGTELVGFCRDISTLNGVTPNITLLLNDLLSALPLPVYHP